jgi:hypothetical protein
MRKPIAIFGGLSHAVYEVAKLWYWNREQDPINQFIVYNARNPLGIFIGVMAHDARNCPNCKQNTGGFLQLVMV